MATNNWYEFEGVEELDTPALLIYRDRVQHNIDQLKKAIPLPLLRPHIKTSKSADVSKMLIEAGIRKFKCATIAEADMLGQCVADDVMLAYQPTKNKLERLFNLIDAYPSTVYSCLVDNESSVSMISEYALQEGKVLPVYIDLNVGMNRTGILTARALPLYNALQKYTGIKFMGFHAYDGHVRAIDLQERIAEVNEGFDPVEALRQQIKQQGDPMPLLVAGGSPTCVIHSTRKNVQCSPGTFVFWDKGYQDTIPEQPFQPAAIVLTRVVSLPADNKICLDLGYKAIACENLLSYRVHFLNAPELQPASHSEEHMTITVPEGHNYKIGDVFYALPTHVCPTVAMYNYATVIANGRITDEWEITARTRELEY